MAVENAGGVPDWVSGLGAFFLLLITGMGQAWQYVRTRAEKPPAEITATGGHMAVVESADLADMRPIRALNNKLDKVFIVLDDQNEKIDEALKVLQDFKTDHEVEKRMAMERDGAELRRLLRDQQDKERDRQR